MDKSICQTCLSKDRRLTPQDNLRELFQDLNICELKDTDGGVCWECQAMLSKFIKFKAKVCQAQQSILCKVQDTKSLSQLTTSKVFIFSHNSDPLVNIEGNHRNNYVKIEIAVDRISDTTPSIDKKPDINEKYDDLYTENDYVDNDELPLVIDDIINVNSVVEIKNEHDDSNESIYTDSIKVDTKLNLKKERRKLLKNLKYDSQITAEDEVKEKFFTIAFTHEDMMRNREEKRNRPNFKKVPFKCDSCVLGFTRKDKLELHMAKKHEENIGPYMCDVCKMRFPNKKYVERHCRKHFLCYRCRLCKFETVEHWAALNHCRVKHIGDKRDSIHCGQCQWISKTPEELAEHIRTQHSLVCNECGEKFKGKNTLKSHISRIHNVKRQYICDICNRPFLTRTRLESHMVTHNASLARTLAYCAPCGVQYKNIYVYRNHLRNSRRHSERKYPCPECNKKFVSKVYWSQHYNFYHLQKSQFSCELCNKLFISDWRLKNHKQTHHGLKRSRDHACNVCGKSFYTQSTLRGHQLTHSEERTYMCEDCGDTFKQRPALYTHNRLVHKGVKRKKIS